MIRQPVENLYCTTVETSGRQQQATLELIKRSSLGEARQVSQDEEELDKVRRVTKRLESKIFSGLVLLRW